MTPAVTVLTNPTAGGGRGSKIGAAVSARLRAHGLVVAAIEGRTPGDAHELLRNAVRTGTDTVVAVGGDGLVNLALQVLAGTDTPLAVVPAGTGNDLARVLGVPTHDIPAAIDLIVDNATRAMDLGLAGGRYFATVLSSGFDSLATERANGLRWPTGPLRYNIAMFLQLAALERLPYTIELDDSEIRLDATLVAIGNGSSYGGGMQICPAARVDDDLLDVTVVRGIRRGRLLRLSPLLYRGTHVGLPEVETYTAKRVTLRSPGIVAYADGERSAALPITVTSAPRSLRVVVGPGSYLY